jgi:hypothetical protein
MIKHSNSIAATIPKEKRQKTLKNGKRVTVIFYRWESPETYTQKKPKCNLLSAFISFVGISCILFIVIFGSIRHDKIDKPKNSNGAMYALALIWLNEK